MNAYAIKPNRPFATSQALKRTPATKENKEMIHYMDSHEFSLDIDMATREIRSSVVKKNDNR